MVLIVHKTIKCNIHFAIWEAGKVFELDVEFIKLFLLLEGFILKMYEDTALMYEDIST